MLPFSTNVLISIVEFFSVVTLHVVYAFYQDGLSSAMFVAIGYIPVLLTLLLYRTIKSEGIIVRSFYITMLITSYFIALQLGTVGMLTMVFLSTSLIIALYARNGLMLEYAIVSTVGLVLIAVFQMNLVTQTCAIQIYFIYLMLYVFSMISLNFMVKGVNSYKAKMEEKNEEARAALEAKGNFLANMSHEIRTPMNAIYGMAELLSEKDFEEQEKEYIGTIKKSSENLLSIINEILDFSKIDSGKMEINEDTYQFNSLIHDVLSIIEFRLKDKSVKLITDIDPNVPRELIGDELRIRQILINLMNNAVNFTHRGHITIHVSWKTDNDFAGILDVAIEDTGIGISAENMKKLFTAFGQVDTRKNRNVEGTGLGLVISRQLLRLMDGDISTSSTPGEGSTFSFTLPQKVKDPRPSNYVFNHEKIEEANQEFHITFKAPTARVMIVDDNKVNLIVASELMKKYGFEPVLVDNGMEAFNRIDEHLIDYDIIFMDHMMPFLDGVEATRKIRELDSQYAKDIPIVALTANAIKGVEKQFRLAGMNDYISKPIHMRQLNDILKKWIPLEKQIRVIDEKAEMAKLGSEDPDTRISFGGESKDIFDYLKGIDIEDGMRNCAGSKNVYIKVLQTFASSNLLPGLNKYFDKEDIENYTVLAHSMKGACRNIGANAAADMAFELEKAGKRDDWDFIDRYHGKFVEEYSNVVRIVTKALLVQNSPFLPK